MHNHFEQIPLDSIVEDSKFQFRRSPYDITPLVESLRQNGQRVPILVQARKDGKFNLLAGFNRLAGLRKLKRPTVEAKIYEDINESEAIQIALQDNIEREDLTPWDMVNAAAELRKQGKTNAEIGKLLKGVTIRTVQRYLTVAGAPADFRKALMSSEISIQQAYEGIVRKIPLREIKKPGQSVRALRRMSRTKKQAAKGTLFRRTRAGGINFSANYRPGESDLNEFIATTSDFLNTLISLRSQKKA